jgi:hypothetical protein
LLDEEDILVAEESPFSTIETELDGHVGIFSLEQTSISAKFWNCAGLGNWRTEQAFLTECRKFSVVFAAFFPLSLPKLGHS